MTKLLRALFERRHRYIVYLSGAILFAVVLRTIFTGPVEFGGDTIKKWQFAKDLLDGLPVADILKDHHTARWGVNIPTTIFMLILGRSWFVYYLIPIAFFAAFLTASLANIRVACERDRREVFFTFIVFLLIIFGDPTYVRSTSQLMPFIFVGLYIALHILFVWRIVQSPTQANIFFAALFMFLAYGAKETSLFYAPGTCVFLLMALGWRRGLALAVNIALYGLLLIAVETLIFSLIFGEFISRINLLRVHFHVLEKVLDETFGKVTFRTLFDGWFGLPVYTTILYAAAVAGAVYYIVKSARQGRAALESLPGLLFLSYGLVHTFALKSIDPLVPFVPPKSKYLADLAPWAAMVVAFGMRDIVRQAADARRQALASLFVGLSLAACIVSLSIPRTWRNDYPTTEAWMWHADQTYRFVAQSVKLGVPIKTRASAERMLEKVIGVELTSLGGGVFVATKRSNAQGGKIPTDRMCIVVESKLAFVRCEPRKVEPALTPKRKPAD